MAACADSSSKDKRGKSGTIHSTRRSSKDLHSSTEPQLIYRNDTLIVDRRAAVFITPDSVRIEKRKKEIGEDDFYIAADDCAFYLSSAYSFLDSVHLKILTAEDKKFVKFVLHDTTNQIIDLEKLPDLWNIYFFDPAGKAKHADMTMIDEEYHSYFKGHP